MIALMMRGKTDGGGDVHHEPCLLCGVRACMCEFKCVCVHVCVNLNACACRAWVKDMRKKEVDKEWVGDDDPVPGNYGNMGGNAFQEHSDDGEWDGEC